MSGQATLVSSVASDMWSIGVILYELYVGKRLFDEALPEEDIVALLCSVSALQIMF
jgi:serine/threonine protein kinase